MFWLFRRYVVLSSLLTSIDRRFRLFRFVQSSDVPLLGSFLGSLGCVTSCSRVGGGGCRDDPGPRGRDGTGGKVRGVNDSRCSLRLVAPLCCVCVFLRATLAPTTLAHDGDESDFVGLFSVLTDVASIVSWCHGFTSMTSMLVSPRRRNTQEYSRPSGPFLF